MPTKTRERASFLNSCSVGSLGHGPKHKARCRPVSFHNVRIGHTHRVGRGLLKDPEDGRSVGVGQSDFPL
jgi:hypothetical protein